MRIERLLAAASLAILVAFLFSAFRSSPPRLGSAGLIPLPAAMQVVEGTFDLRRQSISLSCASEADRGEGERLARVLVAELRERSGVEVAFGQRRARIQLLVDPALHFSPEGYTLQVHPTGIELRASYLHGLNNGIRTLLQLTDDSGRVSCAEIADAPRFGYRGLHLDVSRHFMRVAHIKRMLDLMAAYKYNRFHWHLVDGGGWRMESKKYPLLTELAQARTEADWDKWWIKGDRLFVPAGTPGSYGGYYTQEEIRDIVAYAAERYITVIPEIELPGHSNEVFAAYPHLSCGGTWAYDVSELCIGNPATFDFLEGILEETMTLFPSEYIHIGGDEADKRHWKECPKCQALMKREGLKDEDELQSYAIKRIERFLNERGRHIIGWDEILEGGLAPNATVMSWRGEDGGKAAVRMGRKAIMTPGNPLYFDYYQDNPFVEPKGNGGFNPMRNVYAYNPVPADLSPEEASLILGAQANLWTEYVPDEAQAEYMTWPRALALSEVLWTPVDRKDYQDFLSRANAHNRRLAAAGVNVYPMKNIDLRMHVDTLGRAIRIYADTELESAMLRYTLDGSRPSAESQLYDSVIIVRDSAKLMIGHFDQSGQLLYEPVSFVADYHKAVGKAVHYDCRYHRTYPAGGVTALTDGYRGSWTYMDKRWQGFTETMDVTIDLGQVQPVKRVSAKFMQVKPSWVYMPEKVEVWLSEDGVDFVSLGEIATTVDIEDTELRFEVFRFAADRSARYVRMKAVQSRIKNYFLFTDEIVVE